MLKIFRISSILGGISPTYLFKTKEGQYQISLGIDPEEQVSTTIKRLSGAIFPRAFSKFSATEFTGTPLWIETNPKTTNAIVYTDDGKLHSFDSAIAMRATDEASTALPITITGGSGNGLNYYNNYYYLMEGTDISRYGPMDEAGEGISVQVNWWTNTSESLGSNNIGVTAPFLTALTNTTYPTIGNLAIPNHAGHVHESALYFCDVKSSGDGIISKLQTGPTILWDNKVGNFTAGLTVTGATSGATGLIATALNGLGTGSLVLTNVVGIFQDNEAITDTSTGDATIAGDDAIFYKGAGTNSSSYAALEFTNEDVLPVDIESYGTDLVIAAIRTSDSGVDQGSAFLYFWNGSADSWYRRVELPDPYVTALKNVNGELFIFSGNGKNGYRLSKYIGGQSVQTVQYIDDGYPPFAGAVDAEGNRLVWAHRTSYPIETASVLAYGYRSGQLTRALHNIAIADTTGDNPQMTSLKYFVQSDTTSPRKLILGWQTDSQQGLDKPDSSGTLKSVFRSEVFNIGREFTVRKIIIPFSKAIAANMTIVGKIFTDDEIGATTTLDTINDTNFANSEKRIILDDVGAEGQVNFFLEFVSSSTVPLPIQFPIEIQVEIQDE